MSFPWQLHCFILLLAIFRFFLAHPSPTLPTPQKCDICTQLILISKGFLHLGMGMGMGIGLHIYIVAKGSRGVLKKKKAKNRMLKLWHSKCREAKPAFTKNTEASRFKQKCCQQGVKLSSVQCSFISGCTWSCVCQVQGALCASIRTSPRCSLFCPSVHVDHKVKQTPS